jgi:hypothetical protein
MNTSFFRSRREKIGEFAANFLKNVFELGLACTGICRASAACQVRSASHLSMNAYDRDAVILIGN